jgi:uncharacterized protein involved in type VI secretion and phage assembly
MTAPVAEPDARETKKYYGKYAGVVVNNDAPADGSDHRGEIVVKVEGIQEENPSGSGDRALEVSARPCLPPGFFFVPEPQTHVWVEFAAGEIDEPIWSGVWYPKDAPPKTHDGKAPTRDQKIIRTKKEHVVLIDDTDNAEQVVLFEGKNKNKITIDKNGIVVEDVNKNKITLSSSGIVLDGLGKGRKITIDASNVKLE